MRVALLVALGTACAAAQQPTIRCDTPLRNDHVGMSMVRHGFDYMPEETYRGMNDTWRQLGYERMAQARLSGLRTWYASEWSMPGGWGTPLNFTTPRFEAFAAWLADMKALGIPVTMNAGWWFTQATCGSGPPANCTPTDASLAVYTHWISSSLTELVLNRGLTNLNSLLMFTEPLSYTAGTIPPGYTQQSWYFKAVRALHDQLVSDGVRGLVKLVGPNDGGLSQPSIVQSLNDTVAALGDVLDIYSSHDYNMGSYDRWYSLFTNATAITGSTGKPFWIDEGGAGGEDVRNSSDYGTMLGLWQAAAINAGASNTFLWLWQDQYYVWPLENVTNGDSFANGLHRWGLQYWLPANSTSARPAYYAAQAMSRYMRAPSGAAYAASCAATGNTPGGVIAAAVTGTAALGRQDYLAVLLVNEGSTAASVSVAVTPTAGTGTGTGKLCRYAYDPAAVPSNMQPIPCSGSVAGFGPGGGTLTDVLPARGVVVWAAQWSAAEPCAC